MYANNVPTYSTFIKAKNDFVRTKNQTVSFMNNRSVQIFSKPGHVAYVYHIAVNRFEIYCYAVKLLRHELLK